MKNSWLTYANRSYSSIKNALVKRLQEVVPELTDFSSANLLITLIEMFAGVGEILNYYIDVSARELFLPTTRRLSSALAIAQTLGYNGKGRIPGTAVVTFYAEDTNGDPVSSHSGVNIPAGTQLTDIEGNTWVTLEDQYLRPGYSNIAIPVEQSEYTGGPIQIGISDGTSFQSFPMEIAYAHNSLQIYVDGTPWEVVESLQFSSPSDLHCQTVLGSDGYVHVKFGDGVMGLIPPTNSVITGTWKITSGANISGGPDSITTLVSSITLPGEIDHLRVTNLERIYPGRGVEGLSDIQNNTPLNIYTLKRAVTRNDYEAIAKLAPGVRDAQVAFKCGPQIELYIVGVGGGNPSVALLDSTKSFVEQRAILSIPITTKPSGEARVKGKVVVTANKGVSTNATKSAIEAALAEFYSPTKPPFKRAVNSSDIIGLIDGLPEVDYLTLEWFYLEPYVRPSNLATDINYTISITSQSSQVLPWQLVLTGGIFQLLMGGLPIATITPGVQYNSLGNILNLYIAEVPGNASDGDTWSFVTYPYNKDTKLIDPSIPVFEPGDFLISINPTY